MNRRSSIATMNSTMEQSEEFNSIDIFSKAIMGLILLCVYSTGVYLHIRIIQVSKKEKELTWKMIRHFLDRFPHLVDWDRGPHLVRANELTLEQMIEQMNDVIMNE